MARRNETEKDFPLKAAIRAILWAQGYSTRLDVLLAYNKDSRERETNNASKIGLTDLDVLGVRLDLGFRVHTAVADCKTTVGKVPERLFWLSGVGKFFGSDMDILVRSQSLPEHASPLARSLNISLVGPEDLSILTNTYVNHSGLYKTQAGRDFFSLELLGEALFRLSSLPSSLAKVERYRETTYWMEEPYRQLQRVILALQSMAKEGSTGKIFQLVFADFVWLYVISLWKACEALNAGGLSRLERNLSLYLCGNETGLEQMKQIKQNFEALAHHINNGISLSLLPPYFKNLLELIARYVRRPLAITKLARRAEWLAVGQIVGNLGVPPWNYDEDDYLCSKLLSDTARFLVNASGLKMSFLEHYLSLLNEMSSMSPETESENQATEEAPAKAVVESYLNGKEESLDISSTEHEFRNDSEI
jgi:hypothetical protein